MKHIFTLTLFVFSILISHAQPYPVGVQTITYVDSSRSNRSIPIEVHYPALATGSSTGFAADSFPFVVFGHGFQLTATAYYPFADSLAQMGYIVAFPTTESSLSPSHASFAQDLIFIYNKLISENTNAASLFYQKVIAKGAIAGHSMGGGCAVLSAQYGNPAICYWTLAEATTSPSSITAAASMTKPYLSFAGSYDCIAPYATNQLPTYDSSTSPCKVLIEITGASHCQFGESDIQCGIGESVSGCANPPLSRTAQINTVLSYVEPYLDYYLRGASNAAFDNIYTTDTVNVKTKSCSTFVNGIKATDVKKITVYPNPANDILFIQSDEAVKEINLIDALGQKIPNENQYTDRVNITALPSGIYLLQVTTKDGSSSFTRISKR